MSEENTQAVTLAVRQEKTLQILELACGMFTPDNFETLLNLCDEESPGLIEAWTEKCNAKQD